MVDAAGVFEGADTGRSGRSHLTDADDPLLERGQLCVDLGLVGLGRERRRGLGEQLDGLAVLPLEIVDVALVGLAGDDRSERRHLLLEHVDPLRVELRLRGSRHDHRPRGTADDQKHQHRDHLRHQLEHGPLLVMWPDFRPGSRNSSCPLLSRFHLLI